MLSEFCITIEDFESCLKGCVRNLAGWKRAHHISRHRMCDLGQDMVGFSECLIRAHINATMWILDEAAEANRLACTMLPVAEDIQAYLSGKPELDQAGKDLIELRSGQSRQWLERFARRQNSRAGKFSKESAWELKSAYKAYFYFIRAFHDACYAVLLNLGGSQPGRYSSMGDCIKKEKKPIYDQIRAIPGYIEWFKQFRDKRNLIKEGVNFGICGPQWDVGVNFNKVTPEGGIVVSANPFRLSDLVSAIRHSVAVTELVSQSIPVS